MAKIESLRGMDDILPGEVEKWQWLEEKTRNFFGGLGFKEIRTPILEYTELFSRAVGESSDIVHKEMFSFEDRGGRNVTLRPEMTASVARAVIEKGLLTQASFLQLYYIGPMFRAERPQAGRKRQFHQIGIEIINKTDVVDFNVLYHLSAFLERAGVAKSKFRINDLGSPEAQKKTAQELHKYFSAHKTKLCPDCHYRLEKNVLRIFDCKNGACASVIEKAPWEEIAPLSKEFESLTEQLKKISLPFVVDRRLVRGLDYYNGTVFEVSAEGLGAQDALAGGGRYDRLYEQLGGKSTPCTGFSIGMERLLTVLEKSDPPLSEKIRVPVYFAPLPGAHQIEEPLEKTVLNLREKGIRALLGPADRNLNDHLKIANRERARLVVIVGENEIKDKDHWTVKDMDKKDQKQIKKKDLYFYILGEKLL